MKAEDLAGVLCAVGVPFLSRVVKALSLRSHMGRYAPQSFARAEDLATAIAKDANLASGFSWLFRCHFARTSVSCAISFKLQSVNVDRIACISSVCVCVCDFSVRGYIL